MSIGNLRCSPCGSLVAPIWLTIFSIFTTGGLGCLTPFSSMWVSFSSWIGAWTKLALLLLFLDWHTLWKCPILWHSLHFTFSAAHFCPGCALAFHISCTSLPFLGVFWTIFSILKILVLWNYSVPGSFH